MSKPTWGIAILIAVACGAVGGGLGFFIGIAASDLAREYVGEFELSEEDAEIGNPQSFDSSKYSFQYPSNWIIDDDLGYNLENYVSVYTPGRSYIVVEFDDSASDTEAVLQAKIAEWGNYIAGARGSFFSSYGAYEGSGFSTTVRSYGTTETYRLFCYSEGEITVTITECVFEAHREMVEPGFDLIERTMIFD